MNAINSFLTKVKNTHLFFLTIMKGECDSLLKWLFQQMVALMLLNQDKRKENGEPSRLTEEVGIQIAPLREGIMKLDLSG